MSQTALAAQALALADDSLLLGHRNSEWAGHAPILEEDIAFSSLALDELGHARLWYELHQELTGAEPDRVVFFRPANEWRSTQFVELPKGDWAFSMTRQYLFDAYENVLLTGLRGSSEARIAAIAGKIRPEEVYHLRHTSNWVRRLGLGTEESHRRMQSALDKLWGYTLQLFVPLPGEHELVSAGVMPDPEFLREEWAAKTITHLSASGLTVPRTDDLSARSREQHTADLADLLTDLQQVAHLEQFGVEW